MTLCNMVIEAGGKNGVIPADATTYKYLEVSVCLICLLPQFKSIISMKFALVISELYSIYRVYVLFCITLYDSSFYCFVLTGTG